MHRRTPKPRSCWEDRYRQPALPELVGLLSKQHASLLEAARDALVALEGVSESIEWRGTPWRWTLSYQLDPGRPVAFLVPQPARPRMAIPLSDDLAAALTSRKFSKPVRDAVVFAPRVGEVLWPAWELQSRTQIDELIELARRKHELMLPSEPVAS